MSPVNKDAESQVYGEIVHDTATQTTVIHQLQVRSSLFLDAAQNFPIPKVFTIIY